MTQSSTLTDCRKPILCGLPHPALNDELGRAVVRYPYERGETKPADSRDRLMVLRINRGVPSGGMIAGDPFVVDFVSLGAVLRRDRLVLRNLQPEEIKHAKRDSDHVGDELLVAHFMRSEMM